MLRVDAVLSLRAAPRCPTLYHPMLTAILLVGARRASAIGVRTASEPTLRSPRDAPRGGDVLRAYRRALRTRPGLTNCLAGGMMMLSSDLVCQRLVERPPKADVSRALGALTLGLAWHGVAVGVVLRKVRDVADRFGVDEGDLSMEFDI